MLHKSFKSAKCKTALNLAKSRMKLMKNKKDVQMKQMRREIAQLLQSGQDQTARIRVEHVVREEKTIAAYEMIEIYCELIVARLPIIESQKNCPLDLKEAITSLIFAAPRCGGDIPELLDVRKHFTGKYGKEFVAAAIELRPASGVSRTLVEKLSVKAPDGPMKVKILKGIAEEHNIQWEPNWFKDEDPISSDDTVIKTPQTDNSNRIQMEPLNAKIADDLEEKHAHVAEKSEVSTQRHIHANNNEIPPSSTSNTDFGPSGNISGGMFFPQSSGTALDRQHWKMEFKDATAAAEAAAEAAERASMAARAAAELSIRDSHRHNPSSVHGRSEGDRRYAGSVLQHKHEHSNPTNRSFKERSPSMEGNQRTTIQHGDMTEGHDGRISNNEYNQSERPYDTRQQTFRESESISYRENADMTRQSRDSASIPSTSKGDYYSPESSNFQEDKTEPAENLFHEEPEWQNSPTKFYPQASGYEDQHGVGVFSNLKYDTDGDNSDGSCDDFGQGASAEEDWHAKTTYLSKSNSTKEETISRDYGERNVFEKDEQKYGFDSGASVFVGIDQGPSGLDISEKVVHNVATAVFDDSESDDDEECILDPPGKYESPSDKFSPRHALLHKEDRYFEPDLSESFRKSPIYSKLIEPLPVTFDNYDGPSPKSEDEIQTENSEPEIGSYNDRKPNWDSPMTTESTGSSFVEKGTADSFLSNKHMEENQRAHVGTIGEGKDSESLRSFRLSSEAKDHSVLDYETRSRSEAGMELNLGSLPGGRRNRPSWGSLYTRDGLDGVASPSRYSEAAASDDCGEKEDSEHGSTHYSERSNYEAVTAPTHVDIAERKYSGTIHENVRDTRAKDPAGYFEYDDSVPEEDAAKPVITRSVLGAGISRRTKGSTKSVRSQPSANPIDTAKPSRFSSTSYDAEDSPKLQSESTNSRSRTVGQSKLNDDATPAHRSETRLSREKISFSPDAAEKPATPASGKIPIAKAPSRENSGKLPSHVHPKLPDFETFTAHLQSLRTNRK